MVGFLDARNIAWIQEEISKVVKNTKLVIIHLCQVLLSFWQTGLRKCTHHSQKEDAHIVKGDMIAHFSSQILPYSHDNIVSGLLDILGLLFEINSF